MATLSSLDLFIIVGYLLLLAGIGAYFSRRQTSLDAFLIGGGKLSWLPVGLSLMAALNSGIDYLTQPSATIQFGLVLALGTLSWFVIYPWVAYVAFPFFRRLHVYSIYEYLEDRFDVRVRTLAALIFIAWRLGWMATALYVPCLAIHAASGGAIDLTTMIVIAGVFVTFYTMLGGIQAVIWNDVIQFTVMFGGLGATVWIVAGSAPGGVSEIWQVAQAAGKTDLWVPIGEGIAGFFTQPMTVPALMCAVIIGRMAQYTTDQTMVLRVQSTKTTKDARQAFIVNAAGDALWMLGLTFVGLALFAYFQRNPAPEGMSSDRLLPYFMTQVFPAGAVGLVNAAILAASLSSVDAAIHSGSSVLVVDLYNRLAKNRRLQRTGEVVAADDGREQVRALRAATIVMGVVGTTLACNVEGLGSLLEINKKVTDAFAGPLFGIFLLAMFSPRSASTAALAGGLAGAFAAYLVAYQSSLSFFWPSTFGLMATLLVGYAVSMVTAPPSAAVQGYTWRRIMQTPDVR